MERFVLSETDRVQMETLGITEDRLKYQVSIFQRPAFHVRLKRNCTVGDGIHEISPKETERYLKLHQEAAHAARFLKFVPASGAATRMFQNLYRLRAQGLVSKRTDLQERAREGERAAQSFLRIMDSLPNFAFFGELKETMAEHGLDLERLLEEGEFTSILEYLLDERGLGYGARPKGLLQFHAYPEGSRTSFEEHLVESAHYVRDGNGRCRLHFTVSPEHEAAFHALLERVRPAYEKQLGVLLDVQFSFQKSSTATIAVDLDNQPMREREGRLMFRPGGHGALLENLNDLAADIIYIKNIDNVVPDHLKQPTFLWKRLLGGYLVETQSSVHEHVRALLRGGSQAAVRESEEFVRNRLLIPLPDAYSGWSQEEQRAFLLGKLNCPVRVCGVVRNVGEPGGAPFWVEDNEGAVSVQIVEKAQVDFDSRAQREIWSSSTHFNPVDLVCGVRDHEGKAFDLKRYTNPDAVFISKKSDDGRELKALELPGLWNGSMANWLSLFVEVPEITFNPVKTVEDLLRPQHQPAPAA